MELIDSIWPKLDETLSQNDPDKKKEFIRGLLNMLQPYGLNLADASQLHGDVQACVEELTAERELCEACESAPYTKTDGGENSRYPYKLCDDCYPKLHTYTFPPGDWYNLARRYGCFQYSIGDKNYELESGYSHEEWGTVKGGSSNSMPTLKEVKDDPHALIDYTFTQWWWPEDSKQTLAWKAAWEALAKEAVLDALKAGIMRARTEHMVRCVGDVCRMSIPDAAPEIFRHAWNNLSEAEVDLETLSELSKSVIPENELLQLVLTAFKNSR